MRIIGGQWGGQALFSPPGARTRPTSDAHREALFNILAHALGHASVKVLDLFAGTGALGLEALSRGAEAVVWIESDKAALKAIEKNREKLKVNPAQGRVVTDERMERWAGLLTRECASLLPFDTVFCDPPYGKKLIDRSLRTLELQSARLFAPGALLVAESAEKDPLPAVPSAWELLREWSRGDTRFTFYRRRS